MFGFLLCSLGKSKDYCYVGKATHDCPAGSEKITAFNQINFTENANLYLFNGKDDAFLITDNTTKYVTLNVIGNDYDVVDFTKVRSLSSLTFNFSKVTLNNVNIEYPGKMDKALFSNVKLADATKEFKVQTLFTDAASLNTKVIVSNLELTINGDIPDVTVNAVSPYLTLAVDAECHIKEKSFIVTYNGHSITFSSSEKAIISTINLFVSKNFNIKEEARATYNLRIEAESSTMKALSNVNTELYISCKAKVAFDFTGFETFMANILCDEAVSIKMDKVLKISKLKVKKGAAFTATGEISLYANSFFFFGSETQKFTLSHPMHLLPLNEKSEFQVLDEVKVENDKAITIGKFAHFDIKSDLPKFDLVSKEPIELTLWLNRYKKTISHYAFNKLEAPSVTFIVDSQEPLDNNDYDFYIMNKLKVLDCKTLSVEKVSYQVKKDLDAWDQYNQFTQKRVIAQLIKDSNSIQFELLNNPIYTYLRVMYQNNASLIPKTFKGVRIGDDDRNIAEFVNEHTSGICVYIHDSFSKLLGFDISLTKLIDVFFRADLFKPTKTAPQASLDFESIGKFTNKLTLFGIEITNNVHIKADKLSLDVSLPVAADFTISPLSTDMKSEYSFLSSNDIIHKVHYSIKSASGAKISGMLTDVESEGPVDLLDILSTQVAVAFSTPDHTNIPVLNFLDDKSSNNVVSYKLDVQDASKMQSGNYKIITNTMAQIPSTLINLVNLPKDGKYTTELKDKTVTMVVDVPSADGQHNGKLVKIVAGSVAGVVALIVIVVLTICCIRKRKHDYLVSAEPLVTQGL